MSFWKFIDKLLEVPHVKYFKDEQRGIEIVEVGDNVTTIKDNEIIDVKKKRLLR